MTEPSVGPLTRSFLFADLRGYTAYADARGDRAAADLLDRYRALVREVIARSSGAEIRTEGDPFPKLQIGNHEPGDRPVPSRHRAYGLLPRR